MLLSVESITAGYPGGPDIIKQATLSVEKEEMVSIIGPNGAGKSTLLRAVFGMIDVRAGRVLFQGRDVTQASPRQLLEMGIVFLGQGHNVFAEMTVEENLKLGAYICRDRKLVERRMNAVYELFPILHEKRKETSGYLSGGQKQILEMGRALLLKPTLILIDEPSLGLSPKMAAEVFAEIANLKVAGASILIVEQNAEASLRMSDRAYVIELGTNRMDGPAEAIRTSAEIRREYLGGIE